MRVVARRENPGEARLSEAPPRSAADRYLDVDYLVGRYRAFLAAHDLRAEAYPNASFDLGPGSMALYLGSEPKFTNETVWFTECVRSGWKAWGPIRFDPSNRWWKTHLDMVTRAREMAGDDFLVNIPDIIENVDILSAMRGPQSFCFDLIDEPETVKERIGDIDDLYFRYYDAMYGIVKDPEGGSSFTAFQVWGPGRTAKVQCDFCALMSPGQFRDFVQPSLRSQCAELDNSVYHLDGPDAIKHLDALMEIEELDALQWTCGAGQPDGGNERWLPIYDAVRDAGKSLHISIYDGGFDDWTAAAGKLVKRYGSRGLYFLFPVMTQAQAGELITRAEREWR